MYKKSRGTCAGPYEAVSYTWHPESGPQMYSSVFYAGTDGHDEESSQTIRASENLISLLHRIRHADRDRVLWIDQLCINQEDHSEKEHQIPLMLQVYQQCEQVLFWLGEETSSTQLAFAMIQKLDKIFYNLTEKKEPLPSPAAIQVSDPSARYSLPIATSEEWHPFMELLERNVLQRLWIVQEVVVSPKVEVICGGRAIPFDELGNSAEFLYRSGWITPLQEAYVDAYPARYASFSGTMSTTSGQVSSPLPNVLMNTIGRVDFVASLHSRRQSFHSGNFESLEQLLGSLRRCKTSRDFLHDKVYALLGLAAAAGMAPSSTPGEIPAALLPSYAKPYTDVFRDVTQFLLETGSLGILSHVEDASLRTEGAKTSLPSWVPNFEVFQIATILGLGRNATAKGFVAGGNEQIACTIDNNVLHIDACKLDEVLQFGPYYGDESTTQAEFLEASARLVDLFQPYPTGEAIVDVFWRTLITNTSSNYGGPVADSWRRHFIGSCLQAASEIRLRGILQELGDDASGDAFTQALSEKLYAIEGDHRRWVLMVQSETYNIPLAPYTMNTWAPGLYNVFTRGMRETGRAPDEYLAQNNASLYRDAMRQNCTYRRVFTTAGRGYVGIGPRSVERGDGVYLLKGAKVPFVMRKGEGGMLKIVGECYVHGVMYGEEVKDRMAWERVTIC
ncbi:heterokaryon incompatibility protein-domain-containing protein [Bombardia bombarda]|uniref:Heterokaryon incompatibility protein-domain-containing protein n=1 Tax=Bombardia bombarda TaxID=252184 RepID=A0AA39T0L6_9PEZI|nr:heterokaryon incompatibility protein-domain-containing protein [Bombardia bombarda]